MVNLDRNRRDRLRVEPIIKQIRAIGQVEEIRYQGNLISKIERNYKRVIDQLPYLSGIIILVTVLIIYNTIKLSVYSRRDLIKTLQLIGATRTFIKLPFIIEGVLIGVISVIFVFPALIITVEGLNYIISNFSSLGLKLSFDPFVWFWLFLIVVAITILGSYRAASGFLK